MSGVGRLIAVGLLLVACGGDTQQAGAAAGSGPATEGAPNARDAESTSLADSAYPPAFPAAQPGRLVARSQGPVHFDGSWDARAGLCADRSLLQVVADEPGRGIILLLELPSAGERVTTYPLALFSRDLPEPPAAQAGVRLPTEVGPSAMQAVSGSVEVTQYNDSVVSGRLQAVMHEMATQRRTNVAAVFDSVPIRGLPIVDCRMDWEPPPVDTSGGNR